MNSFECNTSAFSLSDLLNLHSRNLIGKIWRLVIAASLWSIWLAHNEALFSLKRVSKETLVYLIKIRIKKWGKASKLMNLETILCGRLILKVL